MQLCSKKVKHLKLYEAASKRETRTLIMSLWILKLHLNIKLSTNMYGPIYEVILSLKLKPDEPQNYEEFKSNTRIQ